MHILASPNRVDKSKHLRLEKRQYLSHYWSKTDLNCNVLNRKSSFEISTQVPFKGCKMNDRPGC